MDNSAAWKERKPLKSITQVTAQSFHKRIGGLDRDTGLQLKNACRQEMLVAKESYFGQIRAKEPGALSMRLQLAF